MTLNNLGNNLAKTFECFIQHFKPTSKVLSEEIYVEMYLNFTLYICGTGFSQ